jgi:hypothetical protein
MGVWPVTLRKAALLRERNERSSLAELLFDVPGDGAHLPSGWAAATLKASRRRSPGTSPSAFGRGWKNQRLIVDFLGRKVIYSGHCY